MVITPEELKSRLSDLGYRIRNHNGWSFNYTNTLNGEPYKARSVCVVEADTGIGFANVKARRDARFDVLQSMRRAVECVEPRTGRIWEF